MRCIGRIDVIRECRRAGVSYSRVWWMMRRHGYSLHQAVSRVSQLDQRYNERMKKGLRVAL